MKQKLRNQLSRQRKALSTDQQKQASKAIARHLENTADYKRAKRIGFYLAVNGEADPTFLQEHVQNHAENHQGNTIQKQFYLPVLAKGKKQGLLFAPLHEDSTFTDNQFAIPEPVCAENELIKGDQLDLVVVPLLGFDCHGNRLGMGGGFYDRSFAFKNKQAQPSTPLLAGFAYAFQQVEHLDTEEWDVKLDFIVTENGLINC